MRRSLFVLIAGAALAASLSFAARAADMAVPVKAPSYLSYPSTSGWFWGVSASGLGGTASATGAQGGTIMGGRFGIDGGYTGLVGNTFWFAEMSVSAQALNGASPSLSVLSSVNLEERLAIGVPQSTWGAVLSAIPGLGSVAFPTVPVMDGAPALGPSAPYVFASLYQDDVSATLGAQTGHAWLISYGAGVGLLNRLSNGMMLDTSIEWKHGAAGLVVGSSAVNPFQDAYLATARLKF